jgi:hypothetical protein
LTSVQKVCDGVGTSEIRKRLIGAAACAGLFIWLLRDSSSGNRRSLAIDSALKKGTIGSLSPERLGWFTSVANSIATASGITAPIAINQPWRRGSLNIYTTTPPASSISHCDRGNAVYDRELDAIFVDTALFDTSDFQTFLSSTAYANVVSLSDLPFLRTYLQFLILHEVGHRQLHMSIGIIFDSGRPAAAAREREADDFAFEKLTAAYETGPGGASAGKAGADLFDLNLADLIPRDKVSADLAAMAVGMNLSFLFITNPFAPFYQDEAHPTFLARSRSLLHSALAHSPAGDPLVNLLQTVDQLLAREESALRNDITEVLFDNPIADVTFDGHGIRATSVQFTKTYMVPLRDPAPRRTGANNLNFRSVWAGHGKDGSPAMDDWWKTSLWTTPDGRTFAWRRDGSVYVWRDGKWEQQDTSRWKEPIGAGENEVFLPRQPSAAILMESKTSDGGYRDSVVAESGIIATRKQADIMREISLKSGFHPAAIKTIMVTDDSAFVAIKNAGQSLKGVAQLNMQTLEVSSVKTLLLPTRAAQLDSNTALAVIPGATPQFLMISSGGTDGKANGWAVWKVTGDQAPELILEVPYFAGKSNEGRHEFGGKSVEGATWLHNDRLLIAIGNDSLYELDVTARQATPIFHPGDEIVKKRVGRNGMIAVFVQGGFKCYVITPRD